MLKKTGNKKSIYMSWIRSYLLVLLIPIIIGSIIYIQATDIIESEINKSNEAMLRQVQLTIDAHVKDLERIVMEISLDANFNNIVIEKAQNPSIPKYVTVEFQQKLNNFLQFNSFINYLYTFLSDSNRVISSSTATDADTFYLSRYSDQGISYELWEKTMKETFTNQVVQINIANPLKKELAYMQSVPAFGIRERNANIVLVINEQKIKEAINGIQLVSEGTIVILDEDNNIITSTKNSNSSNLPSYADLPSDGGAKYSVIDNESVVITSVASKAIHWKYVSVTPEKVYAQKTQYIKRLTIWGLLICLFIGGALTYRYSRKNYFPLEELFQNVVSKVSKSQNKGGNEYEIIKFAFEDILEAKSQMDRKLLSQKGIMRSNYLEKLLKGRFDNAGVMLDALSTFDVSFETENFAVVLFDIEAIGEISQEKDRMEFNKEFQLIQFIIINISEEVFGEYSKAYGVELDESVALLLNIKYLENESVKEKLKEISGNIQALILEKFNIHVTASISSTHETIIGIPKAYDECLYAMEYKMLSGTEKILCYDDLKEPLSSSYYYPLEVEQKLINSIKTGEYDNIKEILDIVFKRNFDQQGMSIPMAKCLMFNLISTLNKAVAEMSRLKEEHFLENSNSVELLSKCETIDSMKIQIEKVMRSVCEYIDMKSNAEESTMKDAIYAYIESNYQDATLSVEKISDHFGKSRGYLFSQFKDGTGEGLLYQINKVRITKAKQMLFETEVSINEISEKVGMNNVNSFIRVFKKYEGVTPGKYRELMRGK